MAVQPVEPVRTENAWTPVDEIESIVADARATFDSGRTRDLDWRLGQLEAAIRMLEEREKDITRALKEDLGKPELEAYGAEVAYCAAEAKLLMKNLRKWVRPEKVSTPIVTQPGKSRIYKDPLGVVLVISPWNYPFQLGLVPVLGAIAAGNCVVLKPSEVAPATSALFTDLLPRYLDPHAVKIVEGAVDETTALLKERFDHIFYTGNGTVGRIVMGAAAKHLTPVTLELGGKSPCIVDEDVDLEVAAKRIAWGKFYNAGQTCVAPDYILVDERLHDRFVDKLVETVKKFWSDDPQKSEDYGRIINRRHHKRLMKLMDSGEAAVGGTGDEDDCYIAPTVLTGVEPDSAVMQDEIFGPILPVLKIQGADDAVRFINERDKPLALYVFSRNDDYAQQILTRTSSGGATVNHVWLHLANHALPFGGVGESGMGAYHGKGTFDTFVHKKSVLQKPFALDAPIMYPPYDATKKKWLRRLL